MSLATLTPAQRFMYEYGCFVAFWSNFELLLEVAVAELSGRAAKENCVAVNRLTAGLKKQMLECLLLAANREHEAALLNRLFEIAERNNWIHGHILNPRGDFSRLTRLRIEHASGTLLVSNSDVSLDVSPFEAFYVAWGEFQAEVGVTPERCNAYIHELQDR